MSGDLSDTIANQSAKAAATTADGVSVTRRPLPELIAADRYLSEKEALSQDNVGDTLKSIMFRIVPPGGAR